jgi:hypothetical protein
MKIGLLDVGFSRPKPALLRAYLVRERGVDQRGTDAPLAVVDQIAIAQIVGDDGDDVRFLHCLRHPRPGEKAKNCRGRASPERGKTQQLLLICAFNSRHRASRSAIFASQPTGFGM